MRERRPIGVTTEEDRLAGRGLRGSVRLPKHEFDTQYRQQRQQAPGADAFRVALQPRQCLLAYAQTGSQFGLGQAGLLAEASEHGWELLGRADRDFAHTVYGLYFYFTKHRLFFLIHNPDCRHQSTADGSVVLPPADYHAGTNASGQLAGAPPRRTMPARAQIADGCRASGVMDGHVGEQRQRRQQRVQLVVALHVEDADVGVAAHHAPQVRPLAGLLDLDGARAFSAALMASACSAGRVSGIFTSICTWNSMVSPGWFRWGRWGRRCRWLASSSRQSSGSWISASLAGARRAQAVSSPPTVSVRNGLSRPMKVLPCSNHALRTSEAR